MAPIECFRSQLQFQLHQFISYLAKVKPTRKKVPGEELFPSTQSGKGFLVFGKNDKLGKQHLKRLKMLTTLG